MGCKIFVLHWQNYDRNTLLGTTTISDVLENES